MPGTVATDRGASSASEAQRADAFRRLADTYLDDSYRMANAILGDPTDARDAVHDAFVTGWRRWPSLRDTEKFERWFKRIVVNTCKDRLRQASRRRSVDLVERPDGHGTDPTTVIHDRIQIEAGLRRLQPDDRIVLALRYYRDLTVEQIADVLDVPPGTATSRLRNAHIRLRRVLAWPDSKGATR